MTRLFSLYFVLFSKINLSASFLQPKKAVQTMISGPRYESMKVCAVILILSSSDVFPRENTWKDGRSIMTL